ncbi:hypothetical protein [Phocaeicola oris]|uniref:hypothetical protein n=1 Tax=Phocaeicola oris TaxID=2896850 RepID=UPI00234F05C7|nr:hypothetical protein [Phocaeicola oris]MCE2616086.1 hypothetical protein [Phocaeicola oris]
MMTKIEMEAMNAVIGIRKEMEKGNEVNWEQRRYEIAKECLPMVYKLASEIAVHELTSTQQVAQICICLADNLINELKTKK